MSELFDMSLRAMRRDRAARGACDLFLLERAFADCIDRIALVKRRFGQALLLGCPDGSWIERLAPAADRVDAFDPGPAFAERARATAIVEDSWLPPAARYDLVVAVGTLDTVNNLPRVLAALRHSMRPDALLIGAMAGGETLPRLRAAMRAADSASGGASAHIHPRIEAAALAPLLSAAGFIMPVVDIDRVRATYPSLRRLVRDLRAMSATNILNDRPRRPLTRAALAAAEQSFTASDEGGRTIETFEILHFAAWTGSAAHEQG